MVLTLRTLRASSSRAACSSSLLLLLEGPRWSAIFRQHVMTKAGSDDTSLGLVLLGPGMGDREAGSQGRAWMVQLHWRGRLPALLFD